MRQDLFNLRGFKNLGVSGKFILAMLIIMTLFAGLAGITIFHLQNQAMESELLAAENIISEITQQQHDTDKQAIDFKATQLSRLLATIAPQPMAEFDLSLLYHYTEMAISDPDVSYVAYLNQEGKPFATAGDKPAAQKWLELEIEYDDIVLGKLQLGYNYRRAEGQLEAINQIKHDKFVELNQAKDHELVKSQLSTLVLFAAIGAASFVLLSLLLSRLVKRPLSLIVKASQELATGNLTARVDYHSQDEVGQLAQAFNTMADAFQNIIRQVLGTAQNLRASSSQMSEITVTTIQQVKQQHQETEQVATAMTEMAATVQEVARNTAQAADSASHANAEASRGKQEVYDTMSQIQNLATEVEQTAGEIHALSNHAEEIGSIIDVIQSVAEQTNLLALNAAIEAARAGEQGRGFAVVADEVRTLAQRTHESTKEIEDMIVRLQASAKDAAQRMGQGQQLASASVQQAKRAGESLDSITTAVATITDMTTQIASAAEEQSAVANDMHQHITHIRDLSDSTAQNASYTEMAGQALMKESDELNEAFARFKI